MQFQEKNSLPKSIYNNLKMAKKSTFELGKKFKTEYFP